MEVCEISDDVMPVIGFVWGRCTLMSCVLFLFQALIGAISDDLKKRSSLRRGSMVGYHSL